jgi:general secretion pathway protein E
VELDREAAHADGWTDDELAILRAKVPGSHGCSACFDTGFIGRTGIYEFLLMNDDIRDLVNRHASASEIRRAAIARGMTSLRRDGLRKIAAGTTTLLEVRNATQMDLE